jgi:hypothetical protein
MDEVVPWPCAWTEAKMSENSMGAAEEASVEENPYALPAKRQADGGR